MGPTDSLDTILALIEQMEAIVLGLKQLRKFVGKGVATEILELLIRDGETKIAEVKRRVVQ